MIPTGWIVAIAVYVVAMLWVPVTVRAAGNKFWGNKSEGLVWRVIMPPVMLVFWPFTLVFAIVSQYR
jgi:hypothetical protein